MRQAVQSAPPHISHQGAALEPVAEGHAPLPHHAFHGPVTAAVADVLAAQMRCLGDFRDRLDPRQAPQRAPQGQRGWAPDGYRRLQYSGSSISSSLSTAGAVLHATDNREAIVHTSECMEIH